MTYERRSLFPDGTDLPLFTKPANGERLFHDTVGCYTCHTDTRQTVLETPSTRTFHRTACNATRTVPNHAWQETSL